MIYLTTFYLATVFTSLVICTCIAFKAIIFIKKNNSFSELDPEKLLPKIEIHFSLFFFLEIIITVLFMSIFLGWKIVYKALSSDDFITRSAFKIYIDILLEIKNDS